MLPDRLTALALPVRRAVLRRRRVLAAALTAVAVAAGVHAVAAPPPPSAPVLVAARDLPAGTLLRADDLTTVRFAPGTIPSGLADQPVGRTLAAPVRRGEPLTDLRLVGPALTEGYPGLVAVPVRLPDAGMADLLRVGDTIDLLAADPQGSASQVVAAGVPVLALPREVSEVSTSGLTGRLIVVGVAPREVGNVADAAARYFLTIAFAR